MPSPAWLCLLMAAGLCCAAGAQEEEGFGGVPPLGPNDVLRHQLRPYDLVKINYLGVNYCENLLDFRVNTTSYTHLNFDTPCGDAWHLQFPDDTGRLIEGLAWEDEYSPVVRLELIRRLVKGALAARIPGTYAESFFRHRSGGKTFLILADTQGKDGRVLLSNWGDEISGALKVGFRVRKDGAWHEMAGFRYADTPEAAGDPGTARWKDGGRWWNESPYIFRRVYTSPAVEVEFTGRYWLSDENRPLEFSFRAPGVEELQTVIGEPACPMPLLGDYRVPAVLHLPDRVTTYRHDLDGDRVFERPAFHTLVLRRPAAWGAEGYSAALLVMWEGRPRRVEAIADKGYGEIRVVWDAEGGRVWLYPYYWVDDCDLEAIFRSAEEFHAHSRLLLNGFPSQQFLNAIPTGLAAGAYVLARYRDPLAETARVNAARAVDRLFAAEDEGKRLIRVFFPARAAAWMVKLAKEIGDQGMAARYTAMLDRAMARMLSPALAYDGTGWASGWDHFNAARACWLAWDATGNPDHLAAYERALTVFTIDEKGIYRYGKAMEAPGGFETYAGSMPLGLWGHAGRLDWVEKLLNLDVPNGWHHPQTPVRDFWNDAGAGPWAQDDANPEYVGFALRGARLPVSPKHILPVGAFPIYGPDGVQVTHKPIVRNPWFLPGADRPRPVSGPSSVRPPRVKRCEVCPGTAEEEAHGAALAGIVQDGVRLCRGSEGSLVYRFNVGNARGAALDLRVRGDGYRVEVSPDGARWYPRLDTYDPVMADQSLDLSFLTGLREELLRLQTVAPPDDATLLAPGSGSTVEREHCRYTAPGGSLVYRLELPDVTLCRLEMLLGNGYRVECSADGRTWRQAVSCQDVDGGSGKGGADAAWLRMVDVTPQLRRGRVYVKVSDLGDRAAFGGRTAFVRRIAAYGLLRSGQIWVRLSNVSTRPDRSLALERLVLRTW